MLLLSSEVSEALWQEIVFHSLGNCICIEQGYIGLSSAELRFSDIKTSSYIMCLFYPALLSWKTKIM
jgi:hypothetical protein